MNFLLVLGHGLSPEFLLFVLGLLLGLPILVLVLGFRQQSYAGAFLVAGVVTLQWLGLVALSGGSILGIVFGPIGTQPTVKALILDFTFAASLYLLAAVGQWLRVRSQH
jgi:hypothetical protein